MNMSWLELVFAGSVICLAGIGQSAIGFGYALFATPLLLWAGMSLTEVITIVAVSSLIQATLGARHLVETPWRTSLVATAVRLASLLFGIMLLRRLTQMSPAVIRMVVGGILCLLVAIQGLCRARPAAKVAWWWGGLAFAGSGLLAGICGMGGPPLVLWAMAHDWSAAKTRGFLFAVFATSIPVQLVVLRLTFGPDIIRHILVGLAFLPMVCLGTVIGMPLGNRMPKNKLRNIAYLVLMVIGVSAALPGLLALLLPS